MQAIVEQALTEADWQQRCTETMAANGIDEAMVRAELNYRARLLISTPFFLQLGAVLVIWFFPHRPALLNILYDNMAWGVISILAIMATQYLYQKVLLRLHNEGRSLSIHPLKGIAIGTIVPLLPALALAIGMSKIRLISVSLDAGIFGIVWLVIGYIRARKPAGLHGDIDQALSVSREQLVCPSPKPPEKTN